MPMIATLRGRIIALMAAADMRLRSAKSFVVISDQVSTHVRDMQSVRPPNPGA